MQSLGLTGYERDIAGQPAALLACARTTLPPGMASLGLSGFDRVIITGMGSSDYVTIPLERALVVAGYPAWRIQTGKLLELPGLISGRTLLWITSQSGRSGEVVALTDRLPAHEAVTVLAMTNDLTSPLATRADILVALNSGDEATVSSKSYLNSLAWVSRAVATIETGSDQAAVDDIVTTAAELLRWIGTPSPAIADLARRALAGPNPRLALVGTRVDAVTALTGALILKEAAKVAAEGYVGGAFRHGPMELAGPGLTAILFGDGSADDTTLAYLARDLAKTGSKVAMVGPANYAGAEHIPVPHSSEISRLVHSMAVVQRFSVALAREAGLAPGEFRFGQKITAQL